MNEASPVEVFTLPNNKTTIVEALKFCQEKKGLEIYAWVLMSNHLHLIASAKDGFKLPNILRDFKQFTAKRILKAIEEEPESSGGFHKRAMDVASLFVSCQIPRNTHAL
ncbi:MAG: REP element-mobilizing transposase RayT [Flammeovirgaceae bacterium]